MSEEPQLPPLPAIGDVLDRKKRMLERVQSVIKCSNCKKEYTRTFEPGDYTFKKLTEEECKDCKRKGVLTIIEIFSEWYDPKKE